MGKKAGLVRFIKYPELSNLGIVHGKNISHSLLRHAHSTFCVTAIIKGARKCSGRDNDFIIAREKVTLMGPGVVHACQSQTERYSYVTVCVNPSSIHEALERLDRPACVNLDMPLTGVDDHALYSSVVSLAMSIEYFVSDLAVETEYYNFIGSLLPYFSNQKLIPAVFGRNDKMVNTVCEYVTDNYDQNISLREICRLVNLSPFYLTRIFSETVGVPPHLFLNLVRIRKAKSLLGSWPSLTDVAAKVGFFDQSHFIRTFKKIVGMTPKEYKQGITQG
ncbi:MAG: AraC family transcriptional regulator [Veillonellales bacterium]